MVNSTLRMQNAVVLEHLFSKDPEMQKQAQENLDDYIRTKVREDSVVRAILDPVTVTAEDLDPQIGYEEPTVVFEKEPDAPAAVSVPFGSNPMSIEPDGDRFLVTFSPIRTLIKRKSKYLLMGYRNDIRKILTDLDVKEILEHEDRRFFATIDAMLGGAPDTTLSYAGNVALWQTIAGGLTPQSWVDMMQIMPRATGRFVPATVVMNMVRAEEFFSWTAQDLGEEMKQEVIRNGWAQREIDGKRLIVTVKREIVGDDEVYMFAEPNAVGKFCILEDATLYSDAKYDMLEWCVGECIGCTIASVYGVAKATLSD